MLPTLHDLKFKKYKGNATVLNDFENELLGDDTFVFSPIRISVDFENERGVVEPLEFGIIPLEGQVSLYDEDLHRRGMDYDYVNSWLVISDFLVHIDDWFPKLEEAMEEYKLTILMKFEDGVDILSQINDLRAEKKHVLFKVNGYVLNATNAAEFYELVSYIMDKKQDVLKLKQDIHQYLNKRLEKKKISEETHRAYQSMLGRFYYWFLVKYREGYPKVHTEVVEAFKRDSQTLLNLPYYKQEKPLSKGYVNQVLINVVDFVETYLKEDAGVVEPFKIPPRTRETYGAELVEYDMNFIYLVAKYQNLVSQGIAKLSRFRDKMRNFMLFRLSLETMLTNRELTKLKLTDFHLANGELSVNGKKVYLTPDTVQFLKQYKQFRKKYDRAIFVNKLNSVEDKNFLGFIKKVLNEHDYKAIGALKIEEDLKRIKELLKKSEGLTQVEKKQLLEEEKEVLLQRENVIDEVLDEENAYIDKMFSHPLFEFMFISNQYNILSVNAIEKLFKESKVKGTNLTYTREQQLAELNVHPYVVEKIRPNKTPRYDIEITDEITNKLTQDIVEVLNDREMTEVIKEHLIDDKAEAVERYVLARKGSPNIKKYKRQAAEEFSEYSFSRKNLMCLRDTKPVVN